MKKAFLLITILLLLVSCKKNDNTDPYIGTFNLQLAAGSHTFFFINDGGNPGINETSSDWKIENAGNGQYALSPTSDQSRILSNVGGIYVSLVTRPVTLTNNERFTFEPNTSDKDIVNIKSVANNKYIVYQYGLMSNGNICCWAIVLDNKTPCNSDWSNLGADVSDCQYDFKLIKK